MSEERVTHIPSMARSGLGERTRARRRRRKGGEEAAGELKKRRLTEEQVKFLEMNFGKEKKLESRRKEALAAELGLHPKQVAVWFQNKRARWKNKRLEEEHYRLVSVHEAVLQEKRRLEAQVLKLTEELEEKNKKASQVSTPEGGSGSPSSSLSAETQQPLAVEFRPELFSMHEYYYDDCISIADWPDFYPL